MIVCNIDGSIIENPAGRMGIGVYIMDYTENIAKIHKEFEGNPENSNNVAEYLALIECLEWLKLRDYHKEKILIKSDSQLLVNQMNYIWRIKEISEGEKFNKITGKKEYYCNVNNYYKQALKAEELLKSFTNIKIVWVPREQNEIADALSKVSKKYPPLKSGRMSYKEFVRNKIIREAKD
jgi:ribonuclease HI